MNSTDIVRSVRDMRHIVTLHYPHLMPVELDEVQKQLLVVEETNAAQHILYMLERTEHEFALRPDLGKAFRWLGFVQGWAWRDHICPIALGKETNRPKG